MVDIRGTEESDLLVGTDYEDVVSALGGDDAISTKGGADSVVAGDGDDVIDAGKGDDEVFAGKGDDRVNGADGDDWIDGEEGDDIILAGNGNDYVDAGPGNDFVNMGGSTVLAEGGRLPDTAVLGEGADTLYVDVRHGGSVILHDFNAEDRVLLAGLEGNADLTNAIGLLGEYVQTDILNGEIIFNIPQEELGSLLQAQWVQHEDQQVVEISFNR